jgi:putative pyruvate formate lyase activating enzyme
LSPHAKKDAKDKEPMAAPSYLDTFRSGVLGPRVRTLTERLASCDLCPRRCRVNRLQDERGFCRTGRRAVFSSFGPHFGEEDPLVGQGGSGTIFFTHCNLLCCFCQNYDISHEGAGQEIEPEGLARVMLNLQTQGCHNINFVSPTHVIAQIMEALQLAVEEGLRIPLVYNTGGYDLPETLGLLEGVVDIYMPDAKFADGDTAQAFADAPDYPSILREALVEMHRQVGDLLLDEEGVARKGLLIRHLVMPEGLAGTDEILAWISENLSRNTYINIMDQYRPCGASHQHPALTRRITGAEYQEAIDTARRYGLHRLDQRRAFRIFRH